MRCGERASSGRFEEEAKRQYPGESRPWVAERRTRMRRARRRTREAREGGGGAEQPEAPERALDRQGSTHPPNERERAAERGIGEPRDAAFGADEPRRARGRVPRTLALPSSPRWGRAFESILPQAASFFEKASAGSRKPSLASRVVFLISSSADQTIKCRRGSAGSREREGGRGGANALQRRGGGRAIRETELIRWRAVTRELRRTGGRINQ